MRVWVHSEYQLDDQLDGVKINAVAYANFLKEKARLTFRNITFMQDNMYHMLHVIPPHAWQNMVLKMKN